MKTTLDIPDDLFRKAKITAAEEGRSLRELVAEALREKLSGKTTVVAQPPWMKFFGAFGNSEDDRADGRRIQAAIDEEFGKIDPLEK